MNIPNLLSIFRILLVPVFALTYFDGGEYSGLRAALVYAAAAITDVLDGYVARKYNLTSALGRVLDPLGDKLMAFTVLVCITVDGLIPIWAVVVFFTKECLMGVGALLLYKKIEDTPPSNVFGKTSTVVFFAVCVILIVGKGFIQPFWADMMIFGAIFIMLLAFASYLAKFLSIQQNTKGSVQRKDDGDGE
ncbi:MAG: CDP-alcohol phosphatidyltransferase family protein [Oscillospiraceae bacterium]|jgi:CDP-diacylglycerol--glycerol-3-phosphate 3-phosphatidyltransferase|nr:CDP-alcohol phosphatidyltransferase family protein [Oscillospiraceae bacterium]